MNKISRKLVLRNGFSLIEMIVAIAIFMMFTGILITSYVGIVKSLRGAEENRILYSDARTVFDTVVETARNSTIYKGDCRAYNNYHDDTGFIDKLFTDLAFCSIDGTKMTKFKFEKDTNTILQNEKSMLSDKVKLTNFEFRVWPLKDPFSQDVTSDDYSNFFQPKVTIVGKFERLGSDGTVYKIDLQTSVSLRIYN